jgi:hypothetical protein
VESVKCQPTFRRNISPSSDHDQQILYRCGHLQSVRFLTLYNNLLRHPFSEPQRPNIDAFCFRHTVPGQGQMKTKQSALLIVQLCTNKVQNSESINFNLTPVKLYFPEHVIFNRLKKSNPNIALYKKGAEKRQNNEGTSI